MPVPEIHVRGRAQRAVTPDRIVVALGVETATLPSAPEALAACAEARRRLLDDLRAARPHETVRDGRVSVRPEQVRVEEDQPGGTIERWEVAGHRAFCAIELEGPAGDAAAIVAAAGAHADTASVSPRFEVSPELARSVDIELQQQAARDGLERAAGIAAALGMALGGVIAVGEPGLAPEPGPLPGGRMRASEGLAFSAGELEEALGELRPEPETLSATLSVRVALVAPAPTPAP